MTDICITLGLDKGKKDNTTRTLLILMNLLIFPESNYLVNQEVRA